LIQHLNTTFCLADASCRRFAAFASVGCYITRL
jgi:hypothetical protein